MIIWTLRLTEKKKIRKKEKKPNPATVFPKSNCPFWQEGVKIEAAH